MGKRLLLGILALFIIPILVISSWAAGLGFIIDSDGAPSIDGVADTIYEDAIPYDITNVVAGTISSPTDLSATYQALWDADNLYILVEVNDDTSTNDSVETRDDDSIEIYIDADHTQLTSYGPKDYRYIWGWGERTISETANSATTAVVIGSTNQASGYTLEIKLPWSTLGVTPVNEMQIGLDIHINDDDDGGARDGKLTWHTLSNSSDTNPSHFGTAELYDIGTLSRSDTQAPTAPANLSSPGKTDTTIELSWTASVDNNEVVSYQIYEQGRETLLTTVRGTSATLTELSANSSYNLMVKALDGAGNQSVASNILNITTNLYPEALEETLALLNASENGETTDRARLSALVQIVRQDPNISEHDRYLVTARSGGLVIKETLGLTRAARFTAYENLAKNLITEFPQEAEPYESLLALANDQPDFAKGEQLARELQTLSAPEDVKDGAQRTLDRMDMVGQPLDLSFQESRGVTLNTSEYLGKVVVLYAWSARGENSHLWVSRLLTLGGVDTVFIGLNFDKDTQNAQAKINEVALDSLQVYDPGGLSGTLAEKLHLSRIPSIYLIDRSGVLRAVNDWSELAAKLNELLLEGGRS